MGPPSPSSNDEVEEMLGEEFPGEDNETQTLIVEGREIHHMRCASHTFQLGEMFFTIFIYLKGIYFKNLVLHLTSF